MWGIDFCKFRLPSHRHNDQDCKRYTHCELTIERALLIQGKGECYEGNRDALEGR
jgi:hypothetical protein